MELEGVIGPFSTMVIVAASFVGLVDDTVTRSSSSTLIIETGLVVVDDAVARVDDTETLMEDGVQLVSVVVDDVACFLMSELVTLGLIVLPLLDFFA